jgi:hypothetical protein
LTSSSPATSAQLIEELDCASSGAGRTRGIKLIVLQRRKTMAPKKRIGVQIRIELGGSLKK